MNPVIIIPARMASTRLPGKVLEDISGQPMIVRVMNRAEEAGLGPVYVACAEQEIADVVAKAGGKAVLTRPEHYSGTDRVEEALSSIDEQGKYDIVINVQGDLPTIDPEIIKNVLLPFAKENVDIATLVTEIIDPEEDENPNVVKAVVSWDEDNITGKALYFTRARAPAGDGARYHHIGIYAYRRAALDSFVKLPPSPLEKQEKLEQLRALENDMVIGVVKTGSVPFGVDSREDLEKARGLIDA